MDVEGEMKAVCLIRKYGENYWGTLRYDCSMFENTLCYDTELFSSKALAKEEIRRFCKWKGIRISRYLEM